MSILSDEEIRELVHITPFHGGGYKPGVISSGLTSYGYDLRLGRRFKLLNPEWNGVIDPKLIDPKAFIDYTLDELVIPGYGFALGESLEYLEVPRNVLCICLGKSTYARCGIIVNVTPLEPEWRGRVTIEISNTTPRPAKVYAGEGIVQVVFLRADRPCSISYADKKGKYQDQKGIELPQV